MGRRIGHKEKPAVGQRQQKAFILLSLVLLLLIVLPAALQRLSSGKAKTSASAAFQQEAAAYSDTLNRRQEQQETVYRSRYKRQRHDWRGSQSSSQRYGQSSNPYYSSRREPSAAVSAAAPGGSPAARSSYYPPRERLSFELNSADTLDLQQLRGIGPAFARRIVKYRAALGGFVCKEQLQEVYGLPPETYRQIAPCLTLDTSHIRKLNPNTATLNELKRHPYLDYYQARAIVDYRERGHAYRHVSDLLLVSLLTDSVVNRLAPYLVFS